MNPSSNPRRTIRRLILALLLSVIGGAAGATYAAVKTPSYTAKAYLVATASGSDPATALNFAQAYGRIATSGPVLATARGRLADTSGLSDVRSATSPDAPVVEIVATGTSARHTADLANAVAAALGDYAAKRSRDTTVKLSVLAPATVPERPTSPKPPLELAVGAAAGLLIGVLAGLGGGREESPTAPEHTVGHTRVPRPAMTPTAASLTALIPISPVPTTAPDEAAQTAVIHPAQDHPVSPAVGVVPPPAIGRVTMEDPEDER